MNSMVRLLVVAASALMLAAPAATDAAIPSKPLPDLTVAASADSITVRSTRPVFGSFSVYVSGGWRTDGACNEYVPAFKVKIKGLGRTLWGPISIPAVNTTRHAFVDSDHQITESNENNNTAQVPGDYLC